MISQSTYFYIRKYVLNSPTPIKDELRSFLRPYVLVIHRPSGRGFYLDRDYRHIIDVDKCQPPQKSVEFAIGHLCACNNIPAWAMTEKAKEFNTFWLY